MIFLVDSFHSLMSYDHFPVSNIMLLLPSNDLLSNTSFYLQFYYWLLSRGLGYISQLSTQLFFKQI